MNIQLTNQRAGKLLSHFREHGKVPMGSTVAQKNLPNLIAEVAKFEFQDIVNLDRTGFDCEPRVGRVKAHRPGHVGSWTAHELEARYKGNEKKGSLSTKRTFDAGTDAEKTVYTETLYNKNNITTLVYPAPGYEEDTALITTVKKKYFGLTEVVTYQELDAGDFEQWEIADARRELER